MTTCFARLFICATLALALTGSSQGAMDMSSMRHETPQTCADLAIACAATISPTVTPDGTLWVAGRVGDRLFVAWSHDGGKTFSPPVAIETGKVMLDWGPDARPQLAISPDGTIVLTYAIFRDDKFNGEVFVSRSVDGGRSFSVPQPITDVQESQRFPRIAFDPKGHLVAVWLDKRGRIAAKTHGEPYPGAGLAVARSTDDAAHMSEAQVVRDNTCECCRIALAFAPDGNLVVMFRNIFPGGVRDHAVITFDGMDRPGPVDRVSVDDWKTDVCPHQGPSLAVAGDGSYQAVWFTLGAARRGLFYARSIDAGATWSAPTALGPPTQTLSRPYVFASGKTVWLVWKAFDGQTTSVMGMTSTDSGRDWSSARTIATTDAASDHPIMIGLRGQTYLSWQTSHGYRLIAIGGAS